MTELNKYKNKIKPLLKIIINLIIETNKVDKKDSNQLLNLFEEKSHAFGLKIYSNPINNIVKNIDNLLSNIYTKNNDINTKIDDFSYGIFELDIISLKEITSSIFNPTAIKINNSKFFKDEYFIENIDTFINFIFETSIYDNTKKDDEYYLNICIELINVLLIFHKETTMLSNDFANNLLYFCDKLFCDKGSLWKNNNAIINIEENIDKKLKKLLNNSIYEDVFFNWSNELNYGETINSTDYKYQINNQDFIIVKNQKDFCKYLLLCDTINEYK